MEHVNLNFTVDGGCRKIGQPGAIAAAACCFTLNKYENKEHAESRTERLPAHPPPTHQRAELRAMIMALHWALEEVLSWVGPGIVNSVTICSDSESTVKSMTDWVDKWRHNGWRRTSGRPVANLDLLLEACRLKDRVDKLVSESNITVAYKWIPRGENAEADRRCTEALDAMEKEGYRI